VSSGADLGAFNSSEQKLKEQQEAEFLCGHDVFKPADSMAKVKEDKARQQAGEFKLS
jgi:hypothetical protein